MESEVDFWTKPGAATRKRDGKRHYTFEKRRNLEDATNIITKRFFDYDSLSIKSRDKLARATNDSFDCNLAYSLNKRKRFQMLRDPEAFLDRVTERRPATSAFPVALCQRRTGHWDARCYNLCARFGDEKFQVRCHKRFGTSFSELCNRFENAVRGNDVPVQRGKKKRPRKVKNLVSSKMEYDETEEKSDLNGLCFVVDTPHPNPFIQAQNYRTRGPWMIHLWCKNNRHRARVQLISMAQDCVIWSPDSDLFDTETPLNTAHALQDGTKPFTLDEFVVCKIPNAKLKAKSFELVDAEASIELKDDQPGPSTISVPQQEFTAVQKFSLYKLGIESLADVQTLAKEIAGAEFRWLTFSHSCLVDLNGTIGRPLNLQAVIIFEMTEEGCVQVTLNSVLDCMHIPNRVVFHTWADLATVFAKEQVEADSRRPLPTTDLPHLTTTVHPVGDLQLLTDLARSQLGTPTAEFDFVLVSSTPAHDSDALCLQCHAEPSLNLSCGHGVCRRCLRLFALNSVTRGKVIGCPCCETAIAASLLLAVLPLSTLQMYLRRRSGLTGVECPRCRGLLPGVRDCGGVRCGHCRVSFCSRCQRGPHFPLSCHEALEWNTVFDRQYTLALNEKPYPVTDDPVGVALCPCGGYVSLQRRAQFWFSKAKLWCPTCQANFVGVTGQQVDYRGRVIKDGKQLTWLRERDLPQRFGGALALFCFETRRIRDDPELVRLVKRLRPDLRCRVLQGRAEAAVLLECGRVWLHFRRLRARRPTECVRMDRMLRALRGKLLNVVAACGNIQFPVAVEAAVKVLEADISAFLAFRSNSVSEDGSDSE